MHHSSKNGVSCAEIATYALYQLSSLPSVENCNTTLTAALASIKTMVSVLEPVSNCKECYVDIEYRTRLWEICHLIVERFASLYQEVRFLDYNWGLQQAEDFQVSRPVSVALRDQRIVMGDYEPDTEEEAVGVLAFLLRFQINRFFNIIKPIEKELEQYPGYDCEEWLVLSCDAHEFARRLEEIYDHMTANAIELTY